MRFLIENTPHSKILDQSIIFIKHIFTMKHDKQEIKSHIVCMYKIIIIIIDANKKFKKLLNFS